MRNSPMIVLWRHEKHQQNIFFKSENNKKTCFEMKNLN